jgi:hypothetical protein
MTRVQNLIIVKKFIRVLQEWSHQWIDVAQVKVSSSFAILSYVI